MNRKKTLDPRYRVPVIVVGVVQVALTAAALLDLRHRGPDEIRGSRKAWAAASFVNFVGPIAYFALGRRRS
ncbi:hypothetical protein [Rhodococcus tukisamuensis]|uniref:Phospholipase_D-nuclease N-terminal n=1 Tax=Rhodococcus tukisamuensis TaxID=168276 RepID=A0A1G6ZRQ1_9NOCA|nr:hypothetical protein [Rhodococcus tukisamuensis]SDE05210.1 Phospholipase_D-nuclease N-terminal [Rhodococcus tukisamuensis]